MTRVTNQDCNPKECVQCNKRRLTSFLYSVDFSSSPEAFQPLAPCRVYYPHMSSVTYWFSYATFSFAPPFLPFTWVTPRSHAGLSPLAHDMSHISATGSLNGNQTYAVDSPKLGFSLSPALKAVVVTADAGVMCVKTYGVALGVKLKKTESVNNLQNFLGNISKSK
eukprot:1430257-Ditylum_brightwellii.AAC.1